jgi:hypothetical protein
MTSVVPTATPTRVTAGGTLADIRAAAHRITWRVAGATLAIAVALDTWSLVDLFIGSSMSIAEIKTAAMQEYVSTATVNVLLAFAILFTTFVADERAARGAKRLATYAWAVVIGSALGTTAQWVVRQALDLPAVPTNMAVAQPAYVFFEYLIWGSIIVFIYVNRRNALRARARMTAARVERAEAQRRALESRLQVLQARVEPQFLFNTLALVRDLYEIDVAKGARVLGELIVYLRVALPQLRESTSTLGQELTLAGAYIEIMRAQDGSDLAFRIDVPEWARAVRVPPMVVLPLINHVLANRSSARTAPRTIDIGTRSEEGKLRVEIADSDHGFAPAVGSRDLDDVKKRLAALYGAAGTLVCAPSGNGGSRAVIEIPS